MFCPKCGSTLPDDASFCGSCGNKIEANSKSQRAKASAIPVSGNVFMTAVNSAGNAVSKANPLTGKFKTTPVNIVAVIVIALVLILSLMPWFQASSAAVNGSTLLSNSASALGSVSGNTSVSIPKFDEEYSPWQFVELSLTAAAYTKAQAKIEKEIEDSTNSYDSMGRRRAKAIGLAEPQYSSGGDELFGLSLSFGLWVIGLVLSIIGIIRLLLSGKSTILLIGAIAFLISANQFAYIANKTLSDYGGITASPIIVGALSIACIVLCCFIKKQNRTSSATPNAS